MFSKSSLSSLPFNFGPKIKIDPCQIFYETDHVVAFVNLRPVIPGHVLICPKRGSIPSIRDLSADGSELFEVFKAGQLIGKMLSELHKTENVQYTIQDGPEAGQSVPHVHMHVLPGLDQKIGEAETQGRARNMLEMGEEAVMYRTILTQKYSL